jgi:3-isopropylmalate/(R)-2-methylmalate dehydratase small subunit
VLSTRRPAPPSLRGDAPCRRRPGRSFFADIFRTNALKNGLLPVAVDPAVLEKLFALRAANPSLELTIDLAAQALLLPDGTRATFPIDGFSRHCLLNGIDELGYLLSLEAKISSYESRTI